MLGEGTFSVGFFLTFITYTLLYGLSFALWLSCFAEEWPGLKNWLQFGMCHSEERGREAGASLPLKCVWCKS